jgi:hypothetical protein
MNPSINDANQRSEFSTVPFWAAPVTAASAIHPETYRLPRPGERDPYWGLGRAWYYEAEKLGVIKLIRLRKRGNVRGVTLVPFHEVAALIARERAGTATKNDADREKASK